MDQLSNDRSRAASWRRMPRVRAAIALLLGCLALTAPSGCAGTSDGQQREEEAAIGGGGSAGRDPRPDEETAQRAPVRMLVVLVDSTVTSAVVAAIDEEDAVVAREVRTSEELADQTEEMGVVAASGVLPPPRVEVWVRRGTDLDELAGRLALIDGVTAVEVVRAAARPAGR